MNSLIRNKQQSLPISEQRECLPIRKHRDHILYCLENYQIVILIGETGCGKSTQVPQYLYEYGWHIKGLIGVSQLDPEYTVALAERVSVEMGSVVGNTVGYCTRFDQRSAVTTKIVYMTESFLLHELRNDPLLTKYNVIMIDDVHERRILTDIVMALLKKVVQKRKSLKLIISSSLANNAFKEFIESKSTCSVIKLSIVNTVEKKLHPVKIFYVHEPCSNYVNTVAETILNIHKTKPSGDILAFLPGQEEVQEAVTYLNKYTDNENLQIFLSSGRRYQHTVLTNTSKRKRSVIITSSIIDAAKTVAGIKYVVDCGLSKTEWFNVQTLTENIIVLPISKEIAVERARLAGKMWPGSVYRIYSESTYEKLHKEIPPEMCRRELTTSLLNLKALGIDNILRFDFPSAPPAKILLLGLETLFALEALDESGNLTQPIGYFLSDLPLDPMLGKMLYMSIQLSCSEEIISIIALLQVKSIFSKPASAAGQSKGQVAKRRFEVSEGDLITLLNVYTSFIENGQTKEFCGHNFIIYNNMVRACKFRKQLKEFVRNKFGTALLSANGDMEKICKCIISGYFLNTAYLHHSGVYKNMNTDKVLHIHNFSSLYTMPQPQYITYVEIIPSFKLYMNNITVIKKEWLLEAAGHFYKN